MGVQYQFWTIILVGFAFVDLCTCETYMYPGLRRKPSQNTLQQQLDLDLPDVPPDVLARILARRRLQQQFEQQLEAIHQQMSHSRQFKHNSGPNHLQYNQYKPIDFDFTYNFKNTPKQSQAIDNVNNDDRIPFAVGPTDPRYYEVNDNLAEQQQQESFEIDYTDKHLDGVHNLSKLKGPYYKIKAPIDVGPMKPVKNGVAVNNREKSNDGAQLNALLMGKKNKIDDENVIVRQQNGIEGEMWMYMVALIAGVSAAVTVGLIALGIAWYTLQKKTKAAADVEYPAYGVTGPNKDISPSGDRRLAQSAQMYHYQHQKQQIIAMENRQVSDGHGGLSDVESDDDNEEGDYTVYECPGLAPTGEMEVKNPLFLDDTPVTPSGGNATDAQPKPQPTVTDSPQKQPIKKPPRTSINQPSVIENGNSKKKPK